MRPHRASVWYRRLQLSGRILPCDVPIKIWAFNDRPRGFAQARTPARLDQMRWNCDAPIARG
ncbi:hypothetical protein K470DRAFT_255460 [Piedraia hortae CBS 480.64]|uniref:Uncharacterized protein n=1 Tax=Piedraia hortae CBS 480.64 TaxID=1314780 RepID=A0A6A7C6D8_9PEZI|nr:hypothetical protein K470DRAFT_255460 [Piedraia hortae CBS 480.64]